MSGETLTWFALGASSLLGLLAVMRRGVNDPLVVLLGFYIFFAFGPVFNWLTGEKIYFGIVVDQIPTSSLIFLVASFGLFLPTWFIPLNREQFRQSAQEPSPMGRILLPANLVMGTLSVALAARLLLAGGGGPDKIRNIALVGGSWHYLYLLIELYLTTFMFNVGRGRGSKLAYVFNLVAYICYCLVVGERDFIFTLLSLGLHWSLMRPDNKRERLKLILGGAALAITGTSIFFLRDSTQSFSSPFTALLNQGSLLLVNSYTLRLLDGGLSHFWGQSYLYALMNLLPSGLWSTGFNLPDWFRMQYAPGSSSGYGYGLDAEGFLNFGWAGVFITFLLIGIFQRRVFNTRHFRSFSLYFSVFTLAFTMYGVRNDSTAFLKGHFYAVISYAALNFLARIMTPREAR